ncbi:MAG: MotA/TolQ/ExbB proton channel family protein [Chthoniobacterales bacterium]
MKTLLTVSLCSLTLALTSFGQTPPAPPAAGSPATAPAPATTMAPAGLPPTTAPAAGMPPATAPAAGMPPATTTAPGAPAGGAPMTTAPALAPTAPAPGMTPAVAGTSPAAAGASGTASPAAPKDMSTGNILIDKFHKGGPIMWPILLVSIIAIAVVLERVFWWLFRWMRRDPKRIEKVFTAIENGDVAEASRLSRGSRDPVLRMMWNGLNHQHASLQGALQVAAGIEIKRAGRFLVVMDTLVTLAPLLGLLGTITGLMKSFGELGNEELAVQAVTGGISEALIATAGGLGIAIFALIPFNFFTSRVSNLEFELQTAATNLEVMLEAQNLAKSNPDMAPVR